MAAKKILFDETELVLTVMGKKKIHMVNLSADQITNIRFAPCKEFSIFRMVPSQKIIITTSKRSEPIVYTRKKEKKYFEEYKSQLAEFAKRNRITFYDQLKDA